MDLEAYLKDLSSSSPAPGGGSASALTGAIAASLNSMVASITAKKKPELEEIGQKARDIRDDLLRLMEQDTSAFLSLMKAFKEKNESEIAHRVKEAATVPLTTAEKSLQALVLAVELLQKGSKSVFTDSAGAGFLAWAAVRSALLNVLINLPSMKDEALKAHLKEKTNACIRKSDELLQEVIQQSEAFFAPKT